MSEQQVGSVITLPPSTERWAPQGSQVAPIPHTPMAMLALAVSKGMDPATLKDLMDLQDRWEKSEARKAYNRAFAAFKAEAVKIIKNRAVTAGPLQGKRYAELFSVVNAVTPALSANGLSTSWKLTKDDKDWIEVTCTITHELGHSESVSMGGPPDAGGAKNMIQARASTITYLERYTLKAICGVAEDGDDIDGGKQKESAEPDPEGKKILEGCASLQGLQAAWKALTAEQRKTLGDVKDECKARIEAADKASQ